MQKSDWDVFKSKFSNNPEEIFEWVCYILFCKEFNQEMGITRYINQTGIETEPINNKGKLIGWQAKFYETKLSVNKSKILKTLDQVKGKYPDLDEIIFYTNQDWGEGKGANTLPKSKGEIEKKAEELQIKITWRTRSYFDSPFVSEENKQIASYIFNKNDNFLEELEQLKLSTKRIIEQIKNKINYKENEINLERDNVFKSLEESIETNKITLLIGESGVGKTALIKKYYEKNISNSSIFVIRAEQLRELKDIQELFNNNFHRVLNYYTNYEKSKNNIIIIDSLEKLNELNKGLFNDLLYELKGWKIVCTLQEEYLRDIKNKFFEGKSTKDIKLKKLEPKELEELALENKFLLPKGNKKTLDLIRIPFYLNEYLNSVSNKEVDFKENIWKKIDRISEITFLELVNEKIKNEKFYIEHKDIDTPAIQSLLRNNILKIENTNLYISHDLYEELAIEKIIERNFNNCTRLEEILETIENNFLVRKVLKNWIVEKLINYDKRIIELIREIILDNKEIIWKDEVLVAILCSDYSESFFKEFKKELLKNDCELLEKVSNLLELKCQDIDTNSIKILKLLNENRIYLRPKGKGWEEFIKFFCKNIKSIKKLEIGINIIEKWCNLAKSSNKEIYRLSGECAFNLLPNKNDKKIFEIVSTCCLEIKPKLETLLNDILKNPNKNLGIYYKFIEYIFSNEFNCMKIKVNFIKEIFKLANLFWKENKEDIDKRNSMFNKNKKYGLRHENDLGYNSSNPHETFIHIFLKIKFEETLDFIINFVNECTEKYENYNSKNNISQISIYIDNKNKKKQIANQELWELYRGLNYDSKLLESIHMALERDLLEEKREPQKLEDILLKILKNSRSASLTAIVVSVASYFYKEQIKINKILFKTKELFMYDKIRWSKDRIADRFFWTNQIWIKEQKKSDNLIHRKYQLIDIFVSYFKSCKTLKEREEFYQILDEHYKSLDDDNDLKLDLMIRDFRNYVQNSSILNENDEFEFILNEETKKKIDDYNYKLEKNRNIISRNPSLDLSSWSRNQLNGVNTKEIYPKYENIEIIKDDIKKVVEDIDNVKNYIENQILISSVLMSVCVLIKNKFYLLMEEEKEEYKNIIIMYLKKYILENIDYGYDLYLKDILGILPDMIIKYPNSSEEIRKVLVFHFLSNKNERLEIFEKCIVNLQNYYSKEIYLITTQYLLLKPEYNKIKNNDSKEIENFYENNNNFNQVVNYKEINLSHLELEDLLIPLKLLSYKIESKEQEKLIKKIIFNFFKILEELSKNEKNYFYKQINNFIKIYSDLILNNLEELDEEFIKLFEKELKNFELLEYLLYLISENFLNYETLYENFWIMWEYFFDIVVDRLNNTNDKKLAESYLFYLCDTTHKLFNFENKPMEIFKNLIFQLDDSEILLIPILNFFKNEKLRYFYEGIDLLYLIIKRNPLIKLEKMISNEMADYIQKIIDKKFNTIGQIDKEKIKEILIFLQGNKSSLATYLLETNY